MKNFLLEQQQKSERIGILTELIHSHPEARELKRAIAVKIVKKKREEIIDFWTQHHAEIQSGQLVVFFVDECHLLANDVCGYVWGKTDIRIEIPIKNIKDRQTPEWSLRL